MKAATTAAAARPETYALASTGPTGRDEAGEDYGQAKADIRCDEERGDDGCPVRRLSEPVQLAQATAEDEPHCYATRDRAHQEKP